MLDRKVRTTRRGEVEYLRIRLKGSNLSSEKWTKIGKVKKQYPHLVDGLKTNFWWSKIFFSREAVIEIGSIERLSRAMTETSQTNL